MLALYGGQITKVSDVSLKTIIDNSNQRPFLVQNVRCEKLQNDKSSNTLESHINSVYPILPEKAIRLYLKYISITKEKNANSQMTLINLIDRLLTKRAAMFMDDISNIYWDDVKEEDKLTLEERQLASFISVSSHSYFINPGHPGNNADVDSRKLTQPSGIVINVVGPRLKNIGYLESNEMVLKPSETSKSTTLFDFIYSKSAVEETHFPVIIKSASDVYLFNEKKYKERLAISFDVLLLEANKRALELNTQALIHLVGFGLGDWMFTHRQREWFEETLLDRIKHLKINNVSDIVLNPYIRQDAERNVIEAGDKEFIRISPENSKINMYISKRNPNSILPDKFKGKLLVVSYASDHNAYPGNRFWRLNDDDKKKPGEVAMALSSQIAELHNPLINPKVCASNARIVEDDGSITSIVDYFTKNGVKL